MTYKRKTFDILISDSIREIFEVIKSESKVAELLLKKRHNIECLVDNPINYISISKDELDKISYLTSERVENIIKETNGDYNSLWTSSKRYKVKPGAFVAKIFKDISPSEVEKFSNLFRAESKREKFTFKVVKGEDIRSFYHYSKYQNEDKGSLGASCMKYESTQKLLDIYTSNTDQVSMLIMESDNHPDYILGRAILWEFDGNKIMDRIYTSNDESLVFHFKKWATEKGFLYKNAQNFSSTIKFENLKNKEQELFLSINLSNKKIDKYPYMDTFKFMDNDGILYNYKPKGVELKTLACTDGSYYNDNYFSFDIIDRIYRHSSECIYMNYIDSYTHHNNAVYSSLNSTHILKKDSIFHEELRDYIFNDEYSSLNASIEDALKLKLDKKQKCITIDKPYNINLQLSLDNIPSFYINYLETI